ncbi:MAG: M20 family metallo-hydrolase [Candidatus Micrarchaeota archaeon]|nr:M20 family metallo-hydrolase [Candidatus Micrarchaeota archaeon]
MIESSRGEMVKTLSDMIAIPAISPKSGGAGEGKRADFLSALLKNWGFDAKRYEYTDDSGVKRPSLVLSCGSEERTVWIIGHMDTVAVGDPGLWKTDPFKAHVEDGKVYGRGATDDGHGILCSLYALHALKSSGIKLRYNFGLVLAADEEIGSRFGMAKLMSEGIFKKDDMFVVPDFWSKDGDEIEIGEKGLLWIRITVKGKQVHASTPEAGKNAYRFAAMFVMEVDKHLHSKYDAKDPLFDPSYSTFEMTKHEKNVDSVNIIPGVDVSYIDCRILPRYKIDEIIADVRSIAKRDEFSGVQIEVEQFAREDPAMATSADAEVVRLLEDSIFKLRHMRPKKIGIGGNTVALFPRKLGMQAVAWSTGDDIAHQPNEYVVIDNLVEDTKVLAHLFFSD